MIIYASQTGNSESIAKILQSKINHNLYCMKNITEKSISNPLIIIISTTGNGEIPDNGKKFYRLLNKNKPDLSNIEYSILALGDSNYSNFCNAGKKFDTLLNKLNAKKQKIIFADEALGLEKFVEPWLTQIELLYKQNNLIKKKFINQKKRTGKIINTQYTTKRAIILEIEIEDDIIWYPGQSIAIYMINDNKPRYYSIASSPLQDKKYKVIQIIFTIIGKCSSWLSSLKNGDIINFELSELNNFTFDKNIKYMIAIGSGISPFIGFLRHMYYLNLKKENQINWRGNLINDDLKSRDFNITLYYGCRTKNDIICKNILDFFKKEGIIKEIIYAFSRSKNKEYITNKINIDFKSDDKIFICGNNNMIKELEKKYINLKIVYEIWN